MRLKGGQTQFLSAEARSILASVFYMRRGWELRPEAPPSLRPREAVIGSRSPTDPAASQSAVSSDSTFALRGRARPVETPSGIVMEFSSAARRSDLPLLPEGSV
jgi:hypothetical protein